VTKAQRHKVTEYLILLGAFWKILKLGKLGKNQENIRLDATFQMENSVPLCLCHFVPVAEGVTSLFTGKF